MTSLPKHFIIIAGEASGDMHGAHLVEELKKSDPTLTFSGLGGPQMRNAGVELYQDMTRLAVVGFIEVLKHIKELKTIFKLTVDNVRDKRPDAVILIDYPGFNLRLAKELKKMQVKIIYYISPQIWAWKENRIKTITECVDKMLVLFEFEKDFYARHHFPVSCVGHPLIDMVKADHKPEEIRTSLNLSADRLTIGLLPGSREKEIEVLLPIMIRAAEILHRKNPQIQFILLKAPSIPDNLINPFVTKAPLPLQILKQNIYDGIHACHVCMVASGTATLETAILNKPMVIVYKTSLLTWALAKMLVRIPYIGLVNVVARKKIVAECLQYDATEEKIAQELENIFCDEIKIAEIKSELKKVTDSLGQPGASQRAAQEILRTVYG